MERINVVGAGLSGLSTAINLAEKGIPCRLISAQPSERAQSVLAEGGINACLDTMGESDTTEEHFADTMRGGVNLADPNAVAGLTRRAPEIVRWLASLGAPFQMENGRIIQRNFGGQKKKRTAFAKASTGKVLMSALIDAARKYEARGVIERLPHHEFVRLYIDDRAGERTCRGVCIRDSYTEKLLALPGRVVLCSGGMNGFFPGMTTGTTPNNGDATAMAFWQGVELANLEFIQYHPTTFGISGKRCLISEAARGEGGRLYILRDGKPWYFMEELYPELKNLMPRDVVSREMVRVGRREDCAPQVYLDMTGLSPEIWRKKLPDLRQECIHYLGMDPASVPVPVEPGIHFFMGGINVDEAHRTNVKGLYAAGECACQYHGANRLGGNSMLGATYSGRVVAETIAGEAWQEGGAPLEPVHPEMEDRAAAAVFAERMKDILYAPLGILRDEASMTKALERLEGLAAETPLTERQRARVQVGRAMLLSAIARRESRGAHYRLDFPERDDEHFRRTTIARLRDGKVELEFKEIPARREDGR